MPVPLSLIYVSVFGAALLLSVTLTPMLRKLALRLDIVDHPGGRKVHELVTPYLGGVAIYLGFVAVVVSLVGFEPQLIRQTASLLVGGTLLLAVGLWDDRSGMNPFVKLGGQLMAALIAIWSGIQFDLAGLAWIDITLSIVWMVGLSNAVNLLDNMDGLSSGLVAISSTFLFLLAAQGGQFLVASMAAALIGACLGFLRYNFGTASIFMGDAGSLFLGFTLAVLGLKLRLDHEPHVSLGILVLVLALPILDTTLVTFHRIANGRPVYLGGRDHCSHRLVAMGMSRRTAVLTLYLLALGYGVLAMALHSVHGGAGRILIMLAVLGTLILFDKLGRVPVYGRSWDNLPSAEPLESTSEQE